MRKRSARIRRSISVSSQALASFCDVCSRAGLSLSCAIEALIVSALRSRNAESICRNAAACSVRISRTTANRIDAIAKKTGVCATEVVEKLVAREALALACDEYASGVSDESR